MVIALGAGSKLRWHVILGLPVSSGKIGLPEAYGRTAGYRRDTNYRLLGERKHSMMIDGTTFSTEQAESLGLIHMQLGDVVEEEKTAKSGKDRTHRTQFLKRSSPRQKRMHP